MEEFWDSSEVPSKLDETFHRCFHSLVIRGLLPNEAADLALKVATGTVARPIDPSDLMKEFELAKGSARVESLVIKIKSIVSSLDALSISFLPEKGSVAAVAGVDMALLEKFYSSAKELESKDVDAAIMESIECLLSLDKGCWALGNSIVLRNIITLLENRFFSYSVYYGTLQKLWKLILGQPANVKANLLLALQSYKKEQFERLVATVQQFITLLVYENPGNDKVEGGVQILQLLYKVNEKSEFVDQGSFYNDAVNSEDFILADFKRWMDSSSFSFCNYPFIYETTSKSKIMQWESNIQMRNEFQDALLRSLLLERTCPYLVLRVRRENLIRETILQIQFQAEDLKKPLKVNPGLAKGLQQLLQFDGDVEEVFCRSFQVSVQDIFGEFINIELKENGSDISVTRENRKEYVDLCTKYYLETSIASSFDAFKRGFQKLCKGRVLKLFQPFELEQIICGSPILDFEALEKHTVYEDGYRNDTRVICDFWEIVHSLDEENKRKLLFFVTGSDRAPIKGLANLRFVISKNGSHSDRLPSAHTCFNHLLLPEYENKEKLKDRLLIAINNSQGFGLM